MAQPSQILDESDDELIDGDVLADLDGDPEVTGMAESDDDEDGARPLQQDVVDDSIHSFEGHRESVLAVAWCPGSPDLVVTGGQDDRAFLWRVGQDSFDANGGNVGMLELVGHSDSVVALGFNASGNMLASGDMAGAVKVWDTSNGVLLRSLEGPGGAVEWLRWHPRGDVVVAGTEDFMLWMWNAATGACMQVMTGHSGPVSAGAFTSDGKTLVSAGGEGDCGLRVWNPRTGECTATISGRNFHEEAILCLGLHPDGSVAMTGAEDGSVRVTNVTTSRILGALTGHTEAVEAVGFAPGLPLAASASLDGKLLVWDCSTLTERGVVEHPAGITRLAWHPTQPLVFSACIDGTARCVDLRTSSVVRSYTGHIDALQDIALSSDGSMLLTGSDDCTAKAFATEC